MLHGKEAQIINLGICKLAMAGQYSWMRMVARLFFLCKDTTDVVSANNYPHLTRCFRTNNPKGVEKQGWE